MTHVWVVGSTMFFTDTCKLRKTLTHVGNNDTSWDRLLRDAHYHWRVQQGSIVDNNGHKLLIHEDRTKPSTPHTFTNNKISWGYSLLGNDVVL